MAGVWRLSPPSYALPEGRRARRSLQPQSDQAHARPVTRAEVPQSTRETLHDGRAGASRTPLLSVTRDFTVATFVVDAGRVLLLFHNKLAMWLPPGGHIDPSEL